MSVLAVVVLLSGCIPSAPEPQPTPAPLPVAPAATDTAAEPPVQAQTLPPDSDGKPRASLKIDSSAKPNVSVSVEPIKDGAGFNVRGTFNLVATIVPNGPGKWKFSGQFSMAEPDFAAGVPVVTTMGTFGPTANGVAMTTDASMVMIAIPVQPPGAQAPEGTAPRTIPVSLDFDAPEKAEFTVSLTQM